MAHIDTYDYVIIGSGFGGSVSAMRLAEKGYRVVVLERASGAPDREGEGQGEEKAVDEARHHGAHRTPVCRRPRGRPIRGGRGPR